jgi:hypothetical protein
VPRATPEQICHETDTTWDPLNSRGSLTKANRGDGIYGLPVPLGHGESKISSRAASTPPAATTYTLARTTDASLSMSRTSKPSIRSAVSERSRRADTQVRTGRSILRPSRRTSRADARPAACTRSARNRWAPAAAYGASLSDPRLLSLKLRGLSGRLSVPKPLPHSQPAEASKGRASQHQPAQQERAAA